MTTTDNHYYVSSSLLLDKSLLVDYTTISTDQTKSFGTNFDLQNQSKQNYIEQQLYRLPNDQPVTYNSDTNNFYKTLRLTHCDPITGEVVPEDKAFIFPFQWDPYTGERRSLDPYGALYFDPIFLIKYFYTNRLNNLWFPRTRELDAYYGDALGTGPDFKLGARGSFPEWYLFRLPIQNCYLTDSHNSMIVTMGPKLTLEDIKKIDLLASKDNSYLNMFGSRKPSLINMYEDYHNAILPEPDMSNFLRSKNILTDDFNKLPSDKKLKFREECNRNSVDRLARM